MIDRYLEFRREFRSLSGKYLGNIYYPFGWGLETLEVQKQANGLGVEFTPESLPLLDDHKRYTAQLIKSRLTALRGCSDEEIERDGTITYHLQTVIFRFDPSWSDEELDQKIDELLERKVNSFLSSPRVKPCIFGVHYQMEDVVDAIKNALDK